MLGTVYKVQCLEKKEIVDQLCRIPPSPLKGNSKNIDFFFYSYTLNETYLTLVGI